MSRGVSLGDGHFGWMLRASRRELLWIGIFAWCAKRLARDL